MSNSKGSSCLAREEIIRVPTLAALRTTAALPSASAVWEAFWIWARKLLSLQKNPRLRLSRNRWPGPASFGLEVFFMAEDGREAGAVLPAEGLVGGVAGQEGLVDGLVLGMGADGAFHMRLRFSVSKNSFQFSVFG